MKRASGTIVCNRTNNDINLFHRRPRLAPVFLGTTSFRVVLLLCMLFPRCATAFSAARQQSPSPRRRPRLIPSVAVLKVQSSPTTTRFLGRKNNPPFGGATTARLDHRFLCSSLASDDETTTRIMTSSPLNYNTNNNNNNDIASHLYSSSSSSSNNNTETMIIGSTATTGTARRTNDIAACAQHLQRGGLVAFPTETVYGLGCSAIHADAVQAVFRAKERPSTDPLIVHVLEPSDAYPLWKATVSLSKRQQQPQTTNQQNSSLDFSGCLEAQILQTLATAFWPGPLTLVARAVVRDDTTTTTSGNNGGGGGGNAVVPDTVMAGTGFVACRSPQHRTARQLLALTQLPLAAPSANKFGHVSPTTAQHVWDDLQNEANVWILEEKEEEQQQQQQEKQSPSCRVGVESTVAKVEALVRQSHSEEEEDGTTTPTASDAPHYVVTVLRQGAVAAWQLQDCLREAGLGRVTVTTKRKRTTTASPESDDLVAHVAPGQTIRHYSPHVPSYLVSHQCIQKYRHCDENGDADSKTSSTTAAASSLRKAVVLDYAGRLAGWKDFALAYRDLSVTGDSVEAAQHVFDTLRWAEQVTGAERILFPQLLLRTSDRNGYNCCDDDALALAVQDRLTRAASGVVVDCLSETL